MIRYTEGDAPAAISRALGYFGRILNRYDPDSVSWIAGGAITSHLSGREIRDIDVFFPTVSARTIFTKELVHDKALALDSTPTSFKYRLVDGRVLDLVSKYFPTPAATVEDHDFTVAAVAISPFGFWACDNYFTDLATNRLRLNSTRTPFTTLRRLQKYAKRGFWMYNDDLRALAESLRAMPADVFDEQARQKGY